MKFHLSSWVLKVCLVPFLLATGCTAKKRDVTRAQQKAKIEAQKQAELEKAKNEQIAKDAAAAAEAEKNSQGQPAIVRDRVPSPASAQAPSSAPAVTPAPAVSPALAPSQQAPANSTAQSSPSPAPQVTLGVDSKEGRAPSPEAAAFQRPAAAPATSPTAAQTKSVQKVEKETSNIAFELKILNRDKLVKAEALAKGTGSQLHLYNGELISDSELKSKTDAGEADLVTCMTKNFDRLKDGEVILSTDENHIETLEHVKEIRRIYLVYRMKEKSDLRIALGCTFKTMVKVMDIFSKTLKGVVEIKQVELKPEDMINDDAETNADTNLKGTPGLPEMSGQEEQKMRQSFRVLKPDFLKQAASQEFDYRDVSVVRGKIFRTEITNQWVIGGKVGMACRVYIEGDLVTDKDYMVKDTNYVTDKFQADATMFYEYAADAKNKMIFGCLIRKHNSPFGPTMSREIFPTFHEVLKFGTAPDSPAPK